jgi:hypothetical protein
MSGELPNTIATPSAIPAWQNFHLISLLLGAPFLGGAEGFLMKTDSAVVVVTPGGHHAADKFHCIRIAAARRCQTTEPYFEDSQRTQPERSASNHSHLFESSEYFLVETDHPIAIFGVKKNVLAHGLGVLNLPTISA